MEEPSEELLKELECPVCLLIPRGGPVLQCILGHLVCRDCQPRLNKCPVCQANFNKPNVTRNFLAETLLLSIQRGCRYEVLGCDFSSKDSSSLVDHESICCHKPPLPQSSPTNTLSETMELLHVILPIVLLLLRIVGFIMFMLLTFNTRVVTGPEEISNAPLVSLVPDLPDLELPEFVREAHHWLQSWGGSLRRIFRTGSKRHQAFRETCLEPVIQLVKQFKESFIFKETIRLYLSLVDWEANLLHWILEPVKMSCNFQVDGMIQHSFPDAWLPSSLSHLVWTSPSSSASNMTMVWWPANNTYTDGRETRRFLTTKDDCRAATVRSLCRWKLDLTGTPLAVASVILETDGKVIKVWTEELLNSTQEIIMTGVVVKKEDQLDQQVSATEGSENKMEKQAIMGTKECLMSCPDLQTLRWIINFKNIEQLDNV